MVDNCGLKIARHSLSGYVVSDSAPAACSACPFVSPSFLIRLSVDLKPYTRGMRPQLTKLAVRPLFSSSFSTALSLSLSLFSLPLTEIRGYNARTIEQSKLISSDFSIGIPTVRLTSQNNHIP